MSLSRIFRDVLNLFYPTSCEACGDELLGNEKWLCVSCWIAMPKTNFHLQSPNPVEQRFVGRIPILHASSMYYFNKDTRIQEVLHALKYKNKKDIGIELGRRFGHELLDCEWISEIDVILPVPLSKQKLKSRGYNQSECIARGLSEILDIPVDTDAVLRRKNTKSQTSMTIAQRIENVKGAFEVANASSLIGKHILLVDDVLTTGSTLESCAREIVKVPDTKISLLTLAYAIE